MALSDTNTIDTIGTMRDSGEVILTLIDEQDWVNEEDHLVLLQDKINAYIRFVESGEVFESYPDARGRNVVIEIVGKCPLVDAAEAFVKRATEILQEANLELRFRLFE